MVKFFCHRALIQSADDVAQARRRALGRRRCPFPKMTMSASQERKRSRASSLVGHPSLSFHSLIPNILIVAKHMLCVVIVLRVYAEH